jgi:putative ABC transport system substrate-binding protein
MISRRGFLAGSVALLAAPRAAGAQQTGKIWRIGLLDYASDPASSSRWKALRDRLRELGYVEGQNVVFESRWSDGQRGRLPGLATELVNAKVDIIVTAGSEAAAAIKQATSSIPVVLATGGDLVALGVVPSLARPGGNVTGVISMTSELGGKRLELLQQLIPRVSRVAILRDLDNRSTKLFVSDAERASKSLGITLHIVGVHGYKDLDGAFLAIKRARADAVVFAENTAFVAYRQHVADLAVTHRLPMMAPAKEYALAGVLVSYGTDYPDLFRRAAAYVDKILRGARPGDMPIEQPTKFELVINLKTAKALGLTIPPSLLARADQVIE